MASDDYYRTLSKRFTVSPQLFDPDPIGVSDVDPRRHIVWIDHTAEKEEDNRSLFESVIAAKHISSSFCSSWQDFERTVHRDLEPSQRESRDALRIVTCMRYQDNFTAGLQRAIELRRLGYRCPILVFCGENTTSHYEKNPHVGGPIQDALKIFDAILSDDNDVAERFMTFGPIDGFGLTAKTLTPNFSDLLQQVSRSPRDAERTTNDYEQKFNRYAIQRSLNAAVSDENLRRVILNRFHDVLIQPQPLSVVTLKAEDINGKLEGQAAHIFRHVMSRLHGTINATDAKLRMEITGMRLSHNPVLVRRFEDRLADIAKEWQQNKTGGNDPNANDLDSLLANGGNRFVHEDFQHSEIAYRLLLQAAAEQEPFSAIDFPGSNVMLMFHHAQDPMSGRTVTFRGSMGSEAAMDQQAELLFQLFGSLRRQVVAPTPSVSTMGSKAVAQTFSVSQPVAALANTVLEYSTAPRLSHFALKAPTKRASSDDRPTAAADPNTAPLKDMEEVATAKIFVSWVIVRRPRLYTGSYGAAAAAASRAWTPMDHVAAKRGTYWLVDAKGDPILSDLRDPLVRQTICGDAFVPEDENRDVLPLMSIDVSLLDVSKKLPQGLS